MKKYRTNFRVIIQSQTLQVSNLNSIIFNNTSSIDTVKVNTLPIAPGQSLSIIGNENEIDDTNYIIEIPDAPDPNTFYVITKTFL